MDGPGGGDRLQHHGRSGYSPDHLRRDRSIENPFKIIFKTCQCCSFKVYHQQQTTPSPHQQLDSSIPQPLLNRQPLHSCPLHPSLHNSTLHSSSTLHKPLLRSPHQQKSTPSASPQKSTPSVYPITQQQSTQPLHAQQSTLGKQCK